RHLMSKRDWIEVGASLLGGAGIGAAIMYFFDPQLGDIRRTQCRAATGEAISSAGERLGEAFHTVTDKVKGAGEAAADYASDTTDRARSWGHSVSNGARGYARSARRTSGDWFNSEECHSGGTID